MNAKVMEKVKQVVTNVTDDLMQRNAPVFEKKNAHAWSEVRRTTEAECEA